MSVYQWNKKKIHPIASFPGYNPVSRFIEMTSIYYTVRRFEA